ncbi:MAG: hypothetical protein ACXABY_37045 [Candidatus Thorarchaeota archaeon]|jgi:hypothetical protein
MKSDQECLCGYTKLTFTNITFRLVPNDAIEGTVRGWLIEPTCDACLLLALAEPETVSKLNL